MAPKVTASVRVADCVAYVPPGRLDLRNEMKALSLSEEFLSTKTGYLQLARKAPDEDTADLATEVVGRALNRHPEIADTRGAGRRDSDAGWGRYSHVSSIVHGRLNLSEDIAAFDISLGCSGWVYALSIVKAFMEANDLVDRNLTLGAHV